MVPGMMEMADYDADEISGRRMRRVHWPRRTRGASAVGGGNTELVLLPTSRSSGPPEGGCRRCITSAGSSYPAKGRASLPFRNLGPT